MYQSSRGTGKKIGRHYPASLVQIALWGAERCLGRTVLRTPVSELAHCDWYHWASSKLAVESNEPLPIVQLSLHTRLLGTELARRCGSVTARKRAAAQAEGSHASSGILFALVTEVMNRVADDRAWRRRRMA